MTKELEARPINYCMLHNIHYRERETEKRPLQIPEPLPTKQAKAAGIKRIDSQQNPPRTGTTQFEPKTRPKLSGLCVQRSPAAECPLIR